MLSLRATPAGPPALARFYSRSPNKRAFRVSFSLFQEGALQSRHELHSERFSSNQECRDEVAHFFMRWPKLVSLDHSFTSWDHLFLQAVLDHDYKHLELIPEWNPRLNFTVDLMGNPSGFRGSMGESPPLAKRSDQEVQVRIKKFSYEDRVFPFDFEKANSPEGWPALRLFFNTSLQQFSRFAVKLSLWEVYRKISKTNEGIFNAETYLTQTRSI